MKPFPSKPNRNHTKTNQDSITYKIPLILPLDATQMQSVKWYLKEIEWLQVDYEHLWIPNWNYKA